MKVLLNIAEFLRGKKTKIAVILNFLVWGAYGANFIDASTRDMLIGWAASIAAYGFYDMINRNSKKK